MADLQAQARRLALGAVDVLPAGQLERRLAEGRPLRVKLGIDPTAPDIHLGHVVVLEKLRQFQAEGHTVVLIIGDYTARVGDPSGRSSERPLLEAPEIDANATTFTEQAFRILDRDRTEIRFNSEWLDMPSAEIFDLARRFTVARLLERDDFTRRMQAAKPISALELLYPVLQGYDSVAVEADVELGGTDQTFNLLMAREIQRDYGQPPQAVITHPLLVGTDGSEKMSKSLGNAIGISEPPSEMYGKVMSISDALMLEYYDQLAGGEWQELAADRQRLEAGTGDPLLFKQALAGRIVARFHGQDAGREAAGHFRRVVQRKETPDDVPTLVVTGGAEGAGLLALLVEAGIVPSNSEARRMVAQGAVALDEERVSDATLRLPTGGPYLIRVGKRRFVRVQVR
ncbi:MAG: tyrosine--tRNA ligase [Thermoleophilia bacterium]|nr:tyrosine--tRNA ligase [Thermoleophilia bacterium]